MTILFIVGTCPGSGHLPYTATNALIRYWGAVKNHIQGCKDTLANVPTIELYEHPYQFFNPETKKREPRVHTIIRGDVSHYNLECRGFFPSFDQCAAKLTGRLHAEIGNATSEQLRVEARITHACERTASRGSSNHACVRTLTVRPGYPIVVKVGDETAKIFPSGRFEPRPATLKESR